MLVCNYTSSVQTYNVSFAGLPIGGTCTANGPSVFTLVTPNPVTVPAGAAEERLELLDDLAVAAHGAVEALQVAVDDEDQVVEAFAAGQRDRAQRFGFVGLAVA